MKPKPWEINLTTNEKLAFKQILHSLERGFTARCPATNFKTLRVALKVGTCHRLCLKLFPSLLKKKQVHDEPPCPCTTLSTGHKIRVVTKLLTYNRVKP